MTNIEKIKQLAAWGDLLAVQELIDRLEAAEKDAATIRNEALEAAAQVCASDEYAFPRSCAAAIREMIKE